MKRSVGVLLLLLFLLIITSCGDMQTDDLGGFDGVVYNYENDVVINDTEYKVYLPESFKDNIFYSLDRSNLESSSASWIINFNHQVTYYSDLDFTFNEEFYNYVNTLKPRLDSENIIYNFYNDEEIIECEFIIDNPSGETISYGVLVSYIPLKLVDNRYVTYILVPYMVDVLTTKNNMIETVEKDSYIPYEQFLENKKLINK